MQLKPKKQKSHHHDIWRTKSAIKPLYILKKQNKILC